MSSQPSNDLAIDVDSDLADVCAVDYRSFPAGATIIAQGDKSTEVYTLIEGRAVAIQQGRKVGELHRGEIFGVISAFTGSKRCATVVATRDCVVRCIPQQTFVDMVKSQPEIAKAIR